MRLHELDEAKVMDEDGKKIGHVHEVHARDGQITTLVYGFGGIIQRLASNNAGKRISWSDVTAVTNEGIVIRSKKR